MDAPLIPKEMSMLQKVLIYGAAGLLAIYLIVVLILSGLKGVSNSHIGDFLGGAGLILLLVTTYLIYLWIPHDSVDDRVKYAIYAQGAVIVFMATAVLLMVLQTTPCPKCIDRNCPPPNTCDMSKRDNNQWFTAPDCFMGNVHRNQTFILLSPTKDCPKTNNNLFQEIVYDTEEMFSLD